MNTQVVEISKEVELIKKENKRKKQEYKRELVHMKREYRRQLCEMQRRQEREHIEHEFKKRLLERKFVDQLKDK